MSTPEKGTTRSNIDRLNAEGFEIDRDLPSEYEDVIEDLRPDEVELLIDVTRRLDRAQVRAQKCDPDTRGWVTFMHSF
jgi:hypothetical protein